jgi:hypothetical protein
MTSAAQIAANRRNALKSTGPRTALGKTRSAQNARRPSVVLPAASDDLTSQEIVALAQAIAGPGADPVLRELALPLAAAQIDLLRIRRIRHELLSAALRDNARTRRLAAADRYEGRALARRAVAIRNFEAAGELRTE